MNGMKTVSILLALIVVLVLVRKAGAWVTVATGHDYTIGIGGQRLGFLDGKVYSSHSDRPGNWSEIYLGPLGKIDSRFTAIQGLVGFCFILAILAIVPVVLTVRWRKKQASP